MSKRSRAKPDARDVAAEIIRRAAGAQGLDVGGFNQCVVHLGNPPTAQERLKLAACRLLNLPIVIVPAECPQMEEWLARYAAL